MFKAVKVKDMIKVTFDYDPELVNKVRGIQGRKYDMSTKAWSVPENAINELRMIFGDFELEEQEESINRNCFSEELNEITNESIRKFAKWCLEQLPDYFYEVAASSTGKYHPKYSLGKGGLVRHTKAAYKIANELLENHTIQNFNEVEKDIIRISILLHDGLKHGIKYNRYVIATHPLEVVNYIENKMKENNKNFIDDFTWNEIASCIRSHMGEWNTDYKTKQEILPKPKSDMQKFVHLCDYLASRKCIEVLL